MIFKTGEMVVAKYEGRTVKARVSIASANGKSLVIDWMGTDDGMLGGHAGVMPIAQEDDGSFISLLEGLPVELSRLS